MPYLVVRGRVAFWRNPPFFPQSRMSRYVRIALSANMRKIVCTASPNDCIFVMPSIPRGMNQPLSRVDRTYHGAICLPRSLSPRRRILVRVIALEAHLANLLSSSASSQWQPRSRMLILAQRRLALDMGPMDIASAL
jgi:hypothetical protein